MTSFAKKLLASVAALAALAVGGSAIAVAANGGSSSSGGSSSANSSILAGPPANMPAHGTAVHEDAEKAVTGAAAAKAKSAAVKYAGGGTAGNVTTDYTQNGYEVTVTKSDGTSVEVHLDSSFNAMQGPGGPGAAPPSA